MKIKYLTTKNAKMGYPYSIIIDHDNKTITTGYCLPYVGMDETIKTTYKHGKEIISKFEFLGFKHLEG